MYVVICVLLPINAPLEYWGDTVSAAIFVTFSLRYLIVLNVCWLINSAHFIWALDKSSKTSDSNMIFFVTKSFWPQYHYLLPADYQSGEFGNYGKIDYCFSTKLVAINWGQYQNRYRLYNHIYQGVRCSWNGHKSHDDFIKSGQGRTHGSPDVNEKCCRLRNGCSKKGFKSNAT